MSRYFVAATWQTAEGESGSSETVCALTAPVQSMGDLDPVRDVVKAQMEAKFGTAMAWVRLTAVNYLPSVEDLHR